MGMHGASFPFPLDKMRSTSRQVSDAARRVATLAAQITGQPETVVSAGELSPDHPHIAGFRHFIGEPTPEQRFKIDGVDPLASGDHERLKTLMARLANRMGTHSPPAASTGSGIEPGDNPDIPAGYTYLLQLVAHDLVQTSAPVSIIEDTTTGTHNARRSALRLDTIYGGGPLVCPFAYALDDKTDDTRTKLRLMKAKLNPPSSSAPESHFRDIPRAAAAGMNGVQRELVINGQKVAMPTDPLIVDPRNDSHVILSQMTAVFHHLHNAICDLLPERKAPYVNATSRWEAAYERYVCARGAVTLVYRNVLRKDLMKKILRPEIYEAYTEHNGALLDVAPAAAIVRSGWTVPLEFSHGAFRFGHAMIRDRYRLNDSLGSADLPGIINKTSAKEPQNTPLTRDWLVRWSNFFQIKPPPGATLPMPTPNPSRRIGPEFNFPLTEGMVFPPIVEPVPGGAPPPSGFSAGLGYRDLMSAALVGLWSVGALIAEIKRRRPDFIALSPLLDNDAQREQSLRTWLTAPGHASGLDNDDIESLAKDPPLPFFILFEAAHEPGANGLRLGALGSILVADVMFRALRDDPLPSEIGAVNVDDALANLSRAIYDDATYLAGVRHADGEIDSMSRLIEFTAKLAKLENADPTFL